MDYAAFAANSDRRDHAASARVVYEGARRRKSAKRKPAHARKPKSSRKRHGASVKKETTTMARRKRKMPQRGKGGKFVKRSSHRRRARAAAAEAPKKRRTRRRARAVEAPKRHRRRRARAAAAAPRRRRRTYRADRNKAKRRRLKRSVSRAAAPKRRRRRRSRARDPRGTHVYRKRPRIRRRTRRISGKRRRVTLVSPRRRHRRARALENPLTGGELVVGGFTGVLGYVATDVLDRFLATHAFTATAAQGGGTDSPAAGQVYNYQAVAAPMGIKRWGAGLGMAAVPIILAGFVRGPMKRSALQFWGIGALLRTLGKGATDLMVMITGKTAFGTRVFADEIGAANAHKSAVAANAALPALAPISLAGTNLQAGMHGSPARRGVAGCCSNCAAGMPCSGKPGVAVAPQANPVHAGVPQTNAGPPALPPADATSLRMNALSQDGRAHSWRSNRANAE